MSELLVLGHDEVKRLLPMDECVELMDPSLSYPCACDADVDVVFAS